MGNKKPDNKKTVVRNKSGEAGKSPNSSAGKKTTGNTTAGVTAVEKKSAEETPGVSGRRGLSSLQLKIITVIAFLAGNTALMFVDGEANYYSYFALRSIGMMVLPLAVFLMTEGFKHTSNKKMYFVRMFAFGFAAEVPYVTFVNKVFDEKFAKPVAKLLETDKLKLESDSLGKLAEIVSDKKMAYFEDIYNTCYMYIFDGLMTLALIFIVLNIFESAKKKYFEKNNMAFAAIVTFVLSLCLIIFMMMPFEYAIPMLVFASVYYFFEDNRKGIVVMSALLAAVFRTTIGASLAIGIIPATLLIFLYNGKRGSVNTIAKYAFYAIYPIGYIGLYLLSLL